MSNLEVRSSQSALLSSPIVSTSDSRGSSWFSQPFLGRRLQTLHRAGQKQCIMVERTHEGTSNLGVLGEFKHHDDDKDDDSDNDTGQV